MLFQGTRDEADTLQAIGVISKNQLCQRSNESIGYSSNWSCDEEKVLFDVFSAGPHAPPTVLGYSL